MKNCSRALAILAVMALSVSCVKNTRVLGVVADAPQAKVVVKHLDINRFSKVDTLKTDATGAFRYKLNVKKGDPEFLYFFYGDRQIASLILQKGETVHLQTDTLGAYSVKGSEESLKLQQVENAYNACVREMSRILAVAPSPDAALTRRYVAYYRDRVSYVLKNPKSITVVPVFFQQLNDGLPVFNQATDGILMGQVADSLRTVYPQSRYLKALDKEVARRQQLLEVGMRIQDAPEVGYLEIELPGMDGRKQLLSEHLDKVTMLYFWSSTMPEQKMFNLDALVPLYEEFHQKGFEIYAISLDDDKSAWAAAVKNQQLPWVNVCDIRGAQSSYIYSYGVSTLPTAYFLVDGTLDPEAHVRNADDIRSYLKKKL